MAAPDSLSPIAIAHVLHVTPRVITVKPPESSALLRRAECYT
jgi:hypothetical protein